MRKINSNWVATLVLIGLTLWTMKILIRPGFYGSHDGPFMYARAAAMTQELRLGQFPVRVSRTLGFGRGYPVFNYHYPLFFYLSSILILTGLSTATSVKTVIIGVTAWSVFACYRWLKCFFKTRPALVGASLYLLVPYRFLMTFVAGSYGTVLALAMVTTLLWGLSEMLGKENNKAWWLVTFGGAGLVLGHNVTALIFAPVLVLYFLTLWWLYLPSGSLVMRTAMAGFLGLGLAAFFWVPAIFEMNLVRLSKMVAVNYREHFPTLGQLIYWPWGYGYSNPGTANDGMSFMLGVTQWLVVILAAWLVLVQVVRTKGKFDRIEKVAALMAGLFLLVLFLMLNNSNLIWESIPIMKQLQFPWRLMAVEMVVVSCLGAYVVSKFDHLLVVIFFVSLAMLANRHFLLPMTPYLEPESKYADDGFLMKGTTDIAWELAPIDVKQPPPLWPDKKGRKFYMPQWQVLVDGVETRTYSDEDGYLAYEAEADQVVVTRLKSTPLEQKANMISVLSLFGLLLYWAKVETLKAPKV